MNDFDKCMLTDKDLGDKIKKLNLKHKHFSCQMKLLILAQGFIMKILNYFLSIGFTYLLQECFLGCIFIHAYSGSFLLVLVGYHFLTALSLSKPARSHLLFFFLNTCLELYKLVFCLLILLQVLSFVGSSFIYIYMYSF